MKKTRSLGINGFTMIELLLVILVLGILAIVALTQFAGFATDAKNAATKANLAVLRNAIGVMNAMERVRCGKSSASFPLVGTIQSNDISGCTNAPPPHAAVVGVTTPCYYGNLIDPSTGLAYTGGCAADSYADPHYMSLFPIVDRPYVQNSIPPNPWQTSSENTLYASTVTADTPNPTSPGAPCIDQPVVNGAGMLNGKACGTGVLPGSGTAYGVPTNDGGWCYCAGTGQIWANTGNNDGQNAGTGNESQY